MTPSGTEVPGPGHEIKILLLEDRPEDAELAVYELRRTGIRVADLRVETEEAFLRALADMRPDIVLSDFNLPGFDGLAALALTLERAPNTPFILLTGTLDEETAVGCIKAGAWDYIIKQRIARLGPAVEAALEKKRLLEERLSSEEALRDSEVRYRDLFDSARDAIVTLSLQGVFTSLNLGFETITGWSRDEWVGRNIAELLHPDEVGRALARLREVAAGLAGEPMELRVRTKQGGVVHLESVATPRMEGERIVGTLVISRDITQRLVLEQQIRQAQKMESLGTLAGGIAHDFNNMLMVILGYVSLLEDELQLPAEAASHIETIKEAGRRASDLVRQILTFSRRTEKESVPVDLCRLLRDTSAMLAETFPKTITFVVSAAEGMPFIMGDASQLHQAFLNLCVNARDAMPQGGTLTLRAEMASGRDLRVAYPAATASAYAHISVSDTGLGMEESVRERVFEPFFTTRREGTGLGLAVVYGVVQNHHGFAQVESAPSMGTTFHLYLPFLAPVIAGSEIGKEADEEVPRGTETILLVEDEAAILAMLASSVEDKGYRVLKAADGGEAVELYRAHVDEIALVVTDLGLPGMGGDEVLDRLQQINPSVRVMVTSGFVDPSMRTRLTASGAKEIVTKPYGRADVLRKIRAVLDQPDS